MNFKLNILLKLLKKLKAENKLMSDTKKGIKKQVPMWFAVFVITGVTAIFGALFLHYFLLMPDTNFDLFLQ